MINGVSVHVAMNSYQHQYTSACICKSGQQGTYVRGTIINKAVFHSWLIRVSTLITKIEENH